MEFSKNVKDKIQTIFHDNDEIREKLLTGAADTIREIGSISQRGINPEEVVLAFESKDAAVMNNLYQQGKRLVELKNLYKELCVEFYKKTDACGQTNKKI